jgi:hypothetical protein
MINYRQRTSVADAGDFKAVPYPPAEKQDKEEKPDLQLKPQYWLHNVASMSISFFRG